ncbi:TPA: hypothetical protein I7213_12405 [Vibrio vulnificus]|nr:hypothetical protein [Vibrio vulnificus]
MEIITMAKKKCAAHVVVQGHKPGVYTNFDDVKVQIDGYKGKVNWGCGSIVEAEQQYHAICAWRCSSPENKAEKLTLEKAKAIVASILG